MNEHPLERWRLEQDRQGKPMRKRDLAKEIGCSPSRITQMILYGQPPSPALASRIKHRCGISVDDLYEASRELEAAE